MTREEAIQRLLDQLFETNSTPELVCREQPELLAELRCKWIRIRQLQSELDAWFPEDHHQNATYPQLVGGLPVIAGYELLEEVGRGGMGVVYRAFHLSLKRIVAIKLAASGIYVTESERRRFQREAEAVASIDHRHIVKIFDVGVSESGPYFSMEFGVGGTLQSRIAGGPLQPREAASITRDLADAMAAAHLAGIIHRDLKPSNVIINSYGEPKITDFGLARSLKYDDHISRDGVAIGTPSYMAPEQASGRQEDVSPSVDTYALGAILYSLLTATPPFRTDSHLATIEQVLHSDPTPPSRKNSRVPQDLECICLKCLCKEPKRRYESATLLAADLERFLAGEAVHARRETRLGRLFRRIRRRPWATAVATLTACALLLLVGSQLYLVADRAAMAKRITIEVASRNATATSHLVEARRFLERSQWADARHELEQAQSSIGARTSSELANHVAEYQRLANLGLEFDRVRLSGFRENEEILSFDKTDAQYRTLLLDAGFKDFDRDEEKFAESVRKSPICHALISALDHWAACTNDSLRREWLLEVARHADTDPTGWRTQIHNPEIWKDESVLLSLVKSAPNSKLSTPQLLAIELKCNASSDIRVRFLRAVQHASPNDFWANLRLADVLTLDNNPSQAVGFYRAAIAIRPDVAYARHNLAEALRRTKRYAEAAEEFREALKIEPDLPAIRVSLLGILAHLGSDREVLEHRSIATAQNPSNAHLRTMFGKSLQALGQIDDAKGEFAEALRIAPTNLEIQSDFRQFLFKQSRHEEAFQHWSKVLESEPEQHEAWYGHAELSLFLGRHHDYERLRIQLLDRFELTKDPYEAERTARACLLTPVCSEDVDRIIKLASRVTMMDRQEAKGLYPHFQFLRGLAAFRKDKFDEASGILSGDDFKTFGPAPKLVLAMGYLKSGNRDLAVATLSLAIKDYDWRAEVANDQDRWICHILRRETEDQLKMSP